MPEVVRAEDSLHFSQGKNLTVTKFVHAGKFCFVQWTPQDHRMGYVLRGNLPFAIQHQTLNYIPGLADIARPNEEMNWSDSFSQG
jgi:hypothetical protein